jgi:hypothetical protein
MRASIIACLLGGLVLPVVVMAADDEAPPPPGNIALLEGYAHEPLQGFDSIVGRIAKEGGLSISYEIGRVRQPGQLAIGGDFVDQALAVPAEARAWHAAQTIDSQPVHVTLDKQGMLYVTFPESGANFSVEAKKPAQVAEALLMLLSYRAALEEQP